MEFKMCIRTAANEKITIAFNMGVSTLIAMFMGILLRVIGLPCWFVCGAVAVSAVISEHFLTRYPLFVLKYITFTIKEQKVEKKSTKKAK